MASLFRTRQPFLQLNAWQNAAMNGLHYNTSVQGSVVPLIYGTTRVQTNLLDFGDYRGPSGSKGKTGSIPIAGTQTRTGKGGSIKSKKAAPDYTVDVVFEIGQGPITGIGNVYTSAGQGAFSALPLNFYSGADGQAADPKFVSLGHIVGYSGTAVMSATPLDLGPSPVLPNIGVEAIALLVGVNTGAYPSDANPANVIADFLTNSRYGAAFPPANLSDLVTFTGTSYAEYCQASPFVISVSLDGHQKAIEWLDSITKLTNTAMFFSGKLLKLVPFGDLALSNNSATWAPNLVPEYSLTDHHFIPWRQHELGREPSPGEDDPILVTRTNSADADNWMSMEYTDRGNFYNSTTLTVNDQGLIDTYVLRIGDSIQGRMFCNPQSAQISTQLILQRKTHIRNSPYKIQIGWQFARLEPMDIVTLIGRYADLYLNSQPVRILSIEEDDAGGLTIEAEQIQQGVSLPPPPVIPHLPLILAFGAGSWYRAPPAPISSITIGITPTLPFVAGGIIYDTIDDIIVMVANQAGLGTPATVTSITDTSGLGLVWNHRTTKTGTTLPSGTETSIELWWADASGIPPGTTAINITANFSSPVFVPVMIAHGVAGGINHASPWDTNVSLPKIVSGVANPPTITGLSTTANAGIMLAYIVTPEPIVGIVAFSGGPPVTPWTGGQWGSLQDYATGMHICEAQEIINVTSAPTTVSATFGSYNTSNLGYLILADAVKV